MGPLLHVFKSFLSSISLYCKVSVLTSDPLFHVSYQVVHGELTDGRVTRANQPPPQTHTLPAPESGAPDGRVSMSHVKL